MLPAPASLLDQQGLAMATENLGGQVGDMSPGLKPGPEGRQGLGTGPPGTSGPQAMLLTKHSRPEGPSRVHTCQKALRGRAQVAQCQQARRRPEILRTHL